MKLYGVVVAFQTCHTNKFHYKVHLCAQTLSISKPQARTKCETLSLSDVCQGKRAMRIRDAPHHIFRPLTLSIALTCAIYVLQSHVNRSVYKASGSSSSPRADEMMYLELIRRLKEK